MKCQENGCEGEINLNEEINLRVGCSFYSSAYPCAKCGRLHWKDGSLVSDRGGLRPFIENGRLVHKRKDNVVIY